MPKKHSKTLSQYESELYTFYRTNKRMPTYSEACNVFSVKSKDTAHRIISQLATAGRIIIDRARKILPVDEPSTTSQRLVGVPLLGLVEAGFPSPAEEDLSAETISLDDWIIRRREASFMLRVKGDSMYDAGIRDGDMVIVERGTNPKVGDIVIARTEEGWTMKYLRKKKTSTTRHAGPDPASSEFYLEPANPDFPIIEPNEILEIAAVVRGVIRKY
jgi:repressor LexA